MPRVGPAWYAAAGLLLVLGLTWLWPGPPGEPPDAGATEPPEAGEEAEAEPGTPLVDSAELEVRIVDAGASSLTAWNRLLSLWMLRAEDTDVRSAARCPLVLASGVYCLRASGSLTKLRTLRRPVVMRLSASGHEAWAVLLGIDDERARIGLGGDSFDLGRAQLEQAWLGEFFVVWRAPPYIVLPTRRGDLGPSVEWLRDVLIRRDFARLDRSGPAQFDAAMEAGVRRLQAAHGLVPDGIVGPETLLALTADERGGPRLRRSLR